MAEHHKLRSNLVKLAPSRQVLARLRKPRLCANLSECAFLQRELTAWGQQCRCTLRVVP